MSTLQDAVHLTTHPDILLKPFRGCASYLLLRPPCRFLCMCVKCQVRSSVCVCVLVYVRECA